MKPNWSSLQATAFRLFPGDDLKSQLTRLAQEYPLRAATVISCVGSLSNVSLRLAGSSESMTVEGKHEILSLAGTLCLEGIHLHISVANSAGNVIGGHLMEGSTIYTTAEVVIAEMNELEFTRKRCPTSGLVELVVKPRN